MAVNYTEFGVRERLRLFADAGASERELEAILDCHKGDLHGKSHQKLSQYIGALIGEQPLRASEWGAAEPAN